MKLRSQPHLRAVERSRLERDADGRLVIPLGCLRCVDQSEATVERLLQDTCRESAGRSESHQWEGHPVVQGGVRRVG